MQIVRDLAGYSYGRSDLVRRAMSKKKADVMMQEKRNFIFGRDNEDGTVDVPGCVRNGISEAAAEKIFADMETFAQYAFNKSHAAAYAVLAFETGYLKRYYSVEFMAALMSSVMGDMRQISRYIRNCEELGIEVLPPSIHESDKKFTVAGGRIRFGLLGVKNVGEHAIEEIIHARETKGLPKDIFRFIQDIDVSIVNKKAVESLIKAGALDCLNPNRAAHLAVYETLIESAQNEARRNIAGQVSLFDLDVAGINDYDMMVKLPEVNNFERRALLELEKDMLGVYISGHPLDEYTEVIEQTVTVTSRDLAEVTTDLPDDEEDGAISETGFQGAAEPQNPVYDGMKVVAAGIITGKKNLFTKKNQMMAFVDLEDLYGQIEIVVFPNVYERYQAVVETDRVVVITGRLSFREGEAPKMIADAIFDIYDARAGTAGRNYAGGRTDRSARQGYNGGRTDQAARRSYSSDNYTYDGMLPPDDLYEALPPQSDPYDRPETTGSKSTDPETAESHPAGAEAVIKVRIPENTDEKRVMETLAELFIRNSGPVTAYIYRPNGKIISTGDGAGISRTEELKAALEELVGRENVKFGFLQ